MKYARFDHMAASPQPVVGWYDADAFNYPSLPDAADMVELTEEQWATRFDTPFVSGDTLVPATALTAAQLLAKAQLDKNNEIKTAVGASIVSGCTSSALGQLHAYPTTRDDQANLNGLVTESLLPGSGDEYKFWCVDADGVWARRVHTKMQIQSVGKAVSDHVKVQQEKYEQKLSDIAAADANSINAISW